MSNSTNTQLCLSTADDSFNLFETPNGTGSPERRLLLAVLERAILDYVGNDTREREEAEAWLFGDMEEELFEEFSFPWICQELDLDMQSIAQTIYEMPKRGAHKVAPWYFAKHKEGEAAPKMKKKSTKVIEVDFAAWRG